MASKRARVVKQKQRSEGKGANVVMRVRFAIGLILLVGIGLF